MDVTRIFRFRYLMILALLVAGLTIGFAAAAQNTVDSSSAGDGFAEISGFDITAVQYTLNDSNPQNIDSVSFEVSGGAGKPATVKAKLVSLGSAWFDCASTNDASPYAFTCETPDTTVLSVDELRVIAAQ